MNFFDTRFLTLVTSLLLATFHSSLAALPQLFIAEGTSVQEPQEQLEQAFKDAITLARVTASLFDACEPAYTRYFRAIDAVFVKNVFRTIANIPLGPDIDANNIVNILSDASVYELQPKFDKLEIALGNNPSVPLSKQACGKTFDGGTAFAYSYIDPAALGPVALISLCDDTFLFPTLDQIENPPSDKKDAQGNPLPGFTCDGLGDHDTDWMTSPGGIMLHEMMHWTYLLEDIPNYDDIIDGNDDGFPQIADFGGPDPPDGYGPYNTMQLRQKKAAETIQNADSYVWYAQSKYWSWKCQKTMGPAVDETDDEKRLGNRGVQVPPESGTDGQSKRIKL